MPHLMSVNIWVSWTNHVVRAVGFTLPGVMRTGCAAWATTEPSWRQTSLHTVEMA